MKKHAPAASRPTHTLHTKTTVKSARPGLPPPDSAQMSCSSLIVPLSTLCSSHGTCSSNSTWKCECDQGWASQGDLRFLAGLDCDADLQAIMGIWGVILVLSVVSMVVAIRFLCLNIQDVRKDIGKTYVIALLYSSLMCVLSSLRISNPVGTPVGVSGLTTWLVYVSIAIVVVWAAHLIFVFYRITARRSAFTAHKATHRLRNFLVFFVLYCFGTHSMIIVGYYHPEQNDTIVQVCFAMKRGDD